MSEQLNFYGEKGWGHLERHLLSPAHMAAGEGVQKMRGELIKELEEKHRIRKLLASDPLGQEALFRAGILKPNENRPRGQGIQPVHPDERQLDVPEVSEEI